jgi:hypothetical protein
VRLCQDSIFRCEKKEERKKVNRGRRKDLEGRTWRKDLEKGERGGYLVEKCLEGGRRKRCLKWFVWLVMIKTKNEKEKKKEKIVHTWQGILGVPSVNCRNILQKNALTREWKKKKKMKKIGGWKEGVHHFVRKKSRNKTKTKTKFPPFLPFASFASFASCLESLCVSCVSCVFLQLLICFYLFFICGDKNNDLLVVVVVVVTQPSLRTSHNSW